MAVRQALPPAEKDYKIVLRSPIKIAGAILDAETGKPMAKCRLTKGWDPDNRAPDWETGIGHPAQEITDGRYEITLGQQQRYTRIRVEADGYLPAVSRLFKPYDPDRGTVAYDFKMTKAGPMKGTVLDIDGRPLSGVEVFRATQQFYAEKGTASENARRTSRMTKTDAEGRFEFPPEVEPFYLIVLHEKGHIVVDEQQFAKTPTIRIEPWRLKDRSFLLQRKHNSETDELRDIHDTQTLNVRIVDAEGKPVEGVMVATSAEFRTGYNYLGDNEPAWSYFRYVLTDEDGLARMAYQSSIDCVVARHVERKLVAIRKIAPEEVQSSETVTIALKPQCKVTGRVTAKQLEASGGKLEASAVYAYLADGSARPMWCGSTRGDFHFYLPPGTYRLEGYGHDAAGEASSTITIAPGQTELDAGTLDLPPREKSSEKNNV
jgi:protocatechuate 3,4-dioxygenase beta subunit